MSYHTKYLLLAIAALCLLPVQTGCVKRTQWDKYIEAGQTAHKKREYAEAEKSYAAALKEAENFGPQDFRLTRSLNGLARLYGAQGKYTEAEALYKRVLAIKEKTLGFGHRDVTASLDNLAGLYRLQGKYAQAEPLCKRSLAIREKALGPEHPDVAASLENYAKLLRKTKRASEAEKLEARAKAIRAKPR